MKSDIGSLFPAIYKGVLETDILAEIEDVQFDEFFAHMDAARRNQFVVTADIHGIESFERIYNIRANPATEDIEFRRQRILLRMQTKPPFTIRYLRQRLDELIGPDKYRVWMAMGAYNYNMDGSWRLGYKPFRDPTFTLNVEATTVDANWYHEVQVFINAIKPANIVYAFSPLMAAGLGISERISRTNTKWNYKLNGGWKLGAKPFSSPGEPEVMKMPGQSSLQSGFLQDHAAFTADDIASVLINDTVEVTIFLQKDAELGVTTIRYVLPDGHGQTEITNIKLRRADGTVLSNSPVYIPVTDLVTLQHTITHKEVSDNGSTVSVAGRFAN